MQRGCSSPLFASIKKDTLESQSINRWMKNCFFCNFWECTCAAVTSYSCCMDKCYRIAPGYLEIRIDRKSDEWIPSVAPLRSFCLKSLKMIDCLIDRAILGTAKSLFRSHLLFERNTLFLWGFYLLLLFLYSVSHWLLQ